MRRTLTAALLVGLVAPLSAQERTAPIAFDTFRLANGLLLVVHEDHSTPMVAVDVWYDVGSANEKPGRSGFAHLFEHMLFQETENLKAGEFKDLIRSAGGFYNGTTSHDRTNYFEVLPSNRVNLALWMEADRMARLKVTPENFAREREVVKEERRLRYENQPYGLAILAHDTLVQDWPPYLHTPIGSMADLNAATAEDVLAFYKQLYVPNNATIVVAGDVTTAQIKQLAQEYFGGIPRGPEKEPLPGMPEVPRKDGERRMNMESKLATLPLYLAGFTIPPHRNPDTYALELLASMFSTGQSSILYQRLVREEKAALDVFAGLDSRVGPGRFLFGIIPNQGVDAARIEQLVNAEIEKLQRDGVAQQELDKAKNQLRSRIIMGRQRLLDPATLSGKAEELHHYRVFHHDMGEINTALAKYEAVTVNDIRAIAQRYLVPANRSVILVTPAPRTAAGSGPSGTK